MYIYTHIYIYTYICTHIYVYIYTFYIYIFFFVCVCVCVYERRAEREGNYVNVWVNVTFVEVLNYFLELQAPLIIATDLRWQTSCCRTNLKKITARIEHRLTK